MTVSLLAILSVTLSFTSVQCIPYHVTCLVPVKVLEISEQEVIDTLSPAKSPRQRQSSVVIN